MSAAKAAEEPTATLLVAESDAGQRLDRYLAGRLDISRSRAQRWIHDRRVQLAGHPVDKVSTSVSAGDEILVQRPQEPAEAGIEAEPGELRLLYQDTDIAVLDKPAGCLVHPGAGHRSGTLANFLLHRFPEIAGVGGPGRPGIVHRLDKDTTGVLIIARSEKAYRALSKAFAERQVKKTYLAIVHGCPRASEGTVDLAIGRHPRDRKRMTVRPDGRPARTHYRVRASANRISLLELDLETGRTHQIRVHLKALGNPLVGDPTYGEARWREQPLGRRAMIRDFSRPALHAWRLALQHPKHQQPSSFTSPPPADLRDLWSAATETPWPLDGS